MTNPNSHPAPPLDPRANNAPSPPVHPNSLPQAAVTAPQSNMDFYSNLNTAPQPQPVDPAESPNFAFYAELANQQNTVPASANTAPTTPVPERVSMGRLSLIKHALGSSVLGRIAPGEAPAHPFYGLELSEQTKLVNKAQEARTRVENAMAAEEASKDSLWLGRKAKNERKAAVRQLVKAERQTPNKSKEQRAVKKDGVKEARKAVDDARKSSPKTTLGTLRQLQKEQS